ncbi:MAG: 23S rRNA (guanosine(2251)-2'-O)-methyltransferase RlmB [Gammaproteobacteria bacterium]|nr:MAG: 23S rRNA (guanosine(2251)-2'-O)-methyltransferase RlmB [Pseudomonadota bacterium]PIE38947.1 MAG: 23S rRNA (guanosine(2251)-2'-O)-methyltransferase RlmB [Gammaproteobacteria bacterium]
MASDWVFGIHAVQSVLESRADSVEVLYIQKGRNDQKLQVILNAANSCAVKVQARPRHELDKLVKGNHQGVVAKVLMARERDEGDLEELIHALKARGEAPFFLVLDGVTDPHNLGACIRTANGAGVHAVIFPRDKSAHLNATVRKVACGASEFTPVIAVTNLARTMKWLQQNGIWLAGAAGEAESVQSDVNLTGPIAIVMGSEGKGLRRLTKENCDVLAKIPMSGQVDSLNVSVATGIFLYEAVRQRTAG